MMTNVHVFMGPIVHILLISQIQVLSSLRGVKSMPLSKHFTFYVRADKKDAQVEGKKFHSKVRQNV